MTASSTHSIPLGLYVHLPWCVRKCPYCDFNSHPAVGGMDEAAYVQALIRDLDHDLDACEAVLAHREIGSIFFGGGTPSLFSVRGVGDILDGVAARLPLSGDIEITLEANPGAAEQERFTGYRAAGVNRLSIGIQSFDDEMLARLGRIHGRNEASQAARAARAAGFDNFNLDLMFALPGQDMKTAAADLQQALEHEPKHISYYQLTLEPGTHFHRHPPKLPDHDLAWDMQLQGESMLAHAGFKQYEVSAYAHHDRQCRHNLNYWRFGDYLGIGAGAHAKLTDIDNGRIFRTVKERLPLKYMNLAGKAELVTEQREVAVEDRGFEYLLNALRLKQGFVMDELCQRVFIDADKALALLQPALQQGLLRIKNGHVHTTERGWRHIDSILTTLLDMPASEAQKTCASGAESIELRAL